MCKDAEKYTFSDGPDLIINLLIVIGRLADILLSIQMVLGGSGLALTKQEK